MAKAKHYVLTSLTLGLIAAASGLLIGCTFLLTKKTIETNETKRIIKGLKEIYNVDFEKPKIEDLKVKELEYITNYYDLDEGRYAFITNGANSYGKISLLVGCTNNEFVGLYVITNEQTYASTLVENYIDPLNKDTTKIDDVSCGATYGAKLVRDMINQAEEASVYVSNLPKE